MQMKSKWWLQFYAVYGKAGCSRLTHGTLLNDAKANTLYPLQQASCFSSMYGKEGKVWTNLRTKNTQKKKNAQEVHLSAEHGEDPLMFISIYKHIYVCTEVNILTGNRQMYNNFCLSFRRRRREVTITPHPNTVHYVVNDWIQCSCFHFLLYFGIFFFIIWFALLQEVQEIEPYSVFRENELYLTSVIHTSLSTNNLIVIGMDSPISGRPL